MSEKKCFEVWNKTKRKRKTETLAVALTIKLKKLLVFTRFKTIYAHKCKWQWLHTHIHTCTHREEEHIWFTAGQLKEIWRHQSQRLLALYSAARTVCIYCICMCVCLQVYACCVCPVCVLNFSSSAHMIESIIPCRCNLLQLYAIWWWNPAQGTCTVLSGA